MLSLVLSVLLGGCCYPPLPADPPRVALPRRIYALSGTALDIYLDNLVMSYQANGAPYVFTFTGPTGTLSASKWSWTPSASGTQSLALRVAASNGLVMGGSGSTLYVSDGAVAATKVMLVGDSLTDNVVYPPALDALTPAQVTYVGTQTDGGVANEGYTGRTFQWFDTVVDSPFFNGGASLDIAGYLATLGTTPDVVVWMLGVNQIFTAPLSLIDFYVGLEMGYADDLISKWLVAAPSAIHAIVIVAPGSKSDADFYANYGAQAYAAEWTWRQKNHREVESWLTHWTGDGTGGVYLVPANVAVDRVSGYTANAVHPNSTGYGQIASQVYAWLAYVR